MVFHGVLRNSIKFKASELQYKGDINKKKQMFHFKCIMVLPDFNRTYYVPTMWETWEMNIKKKTGMSQLL